MINYKDDIEHPNDFGNGWTWLQADTGATFGPFHGTPGLCSFKTDNLTPWELFNDLFDESMFTHLRQTDMQGKERQVNIDFFILIAYMQLVLCIKPTPVKKICKIFFHLFLDINTCIFICLHLIYFHKISFIFFPSFSLLPYL